MITCIIDGKAGYPSTSENIKVTYNNQYVTDSGEYTYDISFPMAIAENRTLFSNVHRLDVKKSVANFEDCMLYYDNRLIVSGKGTVTSITNETVKLQIVGGTSRIKFNSKFESHMIDEIDYADVEITCGLDKEFYDSIGVSSIVPKQKSTIIAVDLSEDHYVGQPGVAAFNPIYSETYSSIRNFISNATLASITVNGTTYPARSLDMFMRVNCVQPNLMYVLKSVLEFEGYNLVRNDYDIEPWNRLLIASSAYSIYIKDALPHWSVYTFLEEFRKLFNASIIFDELNKTVSIVSRNELVSNDIVCYECDDEFSCEYDDEGLETIMTSNIQFADDGSANRSWLESIPLDVLNEHTVVEFSSLAELEDAAAEMSEKERRTTLFMLDGTYYIYAMLPPEDDPDSTETSLQLTPCGMFSPIMRVEDSEDYEELLMIPVAMTTIKMTPQSISNYKYLYLIPSSADEYNESSESGVDEDGESYSTIQDEIQNGVEEDSEDDSETMRLMFQGLYSYNLEIGQSSYYESFWTDEDASYRRPVTLTDYRSFLKYTSPVEYASLSLHAIPSLVAFKYNGLSGRFNSDMEIDANNQVTIKFVTDDIPDPSNIYVFRNKKYICEKIEMTVSDDGIEPVKTGYFYLIS